MNNKLEVFGKIISIIGLIVSVAFLCACIYVLILVCNSNYNYTECYQDKMTCIRMIIIAIVSIITSATGIYQFFIEEK